MTKMTYADAINYALNLVDNDDVKEKLEALLVSLAKRNSKTGERKPTKVQIENEKLKEDIWAFVSENGAKRAGDVAGYFDISGQKASALLKQLVDAERLEKFTEKRVTYFRVVKGL